MSDNAQLRELTELRFEKQQLGYQLGETRTKLRNNNNHRGLIAVRVSKLKRLQAIDERLDQLKSEISNAPFSRVNLVSLLEKLASVEAAIVDQGYEGGLEALRSFIDFVVDDKTRLEALSSPIDKPHKEQS